MLDPENPDEIIDNITIDKLKEKDFEIISNLLTQSEESLTPLQKDILTAIYWIGNAEKDTISHDKLIKYVIALDALLAQGRSDKSETVAKRYTAIMCQYWKDNDLIQRYCMIKTYYSIRNQIVHGGLRYIDENILKQLRLRVSELDYNLLSYCSDHTVITDLFKNLFPVNEDLLKNVKCEDNLLIV
ncbi:MAG: HEPN domain-containing protein [Thermoproteota archaeon]|nr:HEPN domain-containing protein [Thermoproteota archaeon]